MMPTRDLAAAVQWVMAKMRLTFSSEKNSAGETTPEKMRANPSLASEEHTRRWIFRTATNLAFDHFRETKPSEPAMRPRCAPKRVRRWSRAKCSVTT